VTVPHWTVNVRLDRREIDRLQKYATEKDMSLGAVMRQALRTFDMMEQTAGSYDAVRKLELDKLGPMLAQETKAAPISMAEFVEAFESATADLPGGRNHDILRQR
jgi:hypothetical protein